MAVAVREAEQRFGRVEWERDVPWAELPVPVRAALGRPARSRVALVDVGESHGGGWVVRLSDGPAWISPGGDARPVAPDPPPSATLRGMSYVEWTLGIAAGGVLVAIAVTYEVSGGGERLEDTGDWLLLTRRLPDLADGPLRVAYTRGSYQSQHAG